MFRQTYLVLFAFSILTSGCVGPLVVDETARTVGENNSEIVAGGGQAGAAIKYTYGITDKLDVGVHWESLSVGLRLKYAFLDNQEKGWSAAVAGGIGSSTGGSHYYGDLMGSYLFGTFEPFGTFRYVHVSTNPQDLKDKDTDQTLFTIPSFSFNYGELIFGTRIWIDKHWLFTVEAGTLLALTPGLSFSNGVIIDGAFGYRF